jgi:hypothetical protein
MSKASQTLKNDYSGCGTNRLFSASELDAIYNPTRERALSAVAGEVRP